MNFHTATLGELRTWCHNLNVQLHQLKGEDRLVARRQLHKVEAEIVRRKQIKQELAS